MDKLVNENLKTEKYFVVSCKCLYVNIDEYEKSFNKTLHLKMETIISLIYDYCKEHNIKEVAFYSDNYKQILKILQHDISDIHVIK